MLGKDLVAMADFSSQELERTLDQASQMKQDGAEPVLRGRSLALLFEKPSLRTRVSFEVAMRQLGGHALYLSPAEVGLGQRESVRDAARVLSRYVDAIAARTFAQTTVAELAQEASVPVINALSDEEHPCQALADLLTIRECKGRLAGVTVAFVGDANNVARSLAVGCALSGAHFRIASPPGYGLAGDVSDTFVRLGKATGARLWTGESPHEAVRGADVVYTDVWTSMGQEAEAEERRRVFADYQVNARLLAGAQTEAIVMHPLPAHWSEEIATDLQDRPQLAIYDQAENRLHAQKALLVTLLGGSRS